MAALTRIRGTLTIGRRGDGSAWTDDDLDRLIGHEPKIGDARGKIIDVHPRADGTAAVLVEIPVTTHVVTLADGRTSISISIGDRT